MKEVTLAEKEEQIINDIITLQGIGEELWQYHPDNNQKIDVVKSYNNIKSKISDLESQLKEIF